MIYNHNEEENSKPQKKDVLATILSGILLMACVTVALVIVIPILMFIVDLFF